MTLLQCFTTSQRTEGGEFIHSLLIGFAPGDDHPGGVFRIDLSPGETAEAVSAKLAELADQIAALGDDLTNETAAPDLPIM